MDTAAQNFSLDISIPLQPRSFNIESSKIPAITSIFCPRFPSISLAFSSVFSNGTSWNFISGYIFCILGHRSTNTCGGVSGDIPTRITSSDVCIASFALFTDSLQYPIIYFASLYIDFPASVTTSPLCVLENNCKPRLASSELICFMTAGGEMNSLSAALLKLPASTTHIKVSSCGLYII